MATSIGVYARLRPVARRAEEGISVDSSGCSILVRNLEFQLDRIFDESASQEEVYEVVGRDRVAQIMKGFNVCLVAYGQTGSGKTHTMFGPDEVLANWRGAAAEQHGIALRAMSDLFEAAATVDAYAITCSYVEVYNDTCNDLLAPQKKPLPLRESPSGAPYVAGLTEEAVANVDYALSALSRGTTRRATAQMSMNARSSRSHAVFSLTLRGRAGSADGSTTSGKLVLVDLAGMESSKKSCAIEGASSAGPRREEAKHINTSLYALGTVIERLSAAGRDGASAGVLSHVPFRNSKLTRLLQECLHGNTAPAFVATLRAEAHNLEECMATLRFAQRAKAIPVVVRANVHTPPPDAESLRRELKAVTRELTDAKATIERLQREVGAANSSRRRAAEADDADDARESALLAGRLQLGMLSEQMAALVEQSRDLAAPVAEARDACGVAGGGGFWPWEGAMTSTGSSSQVAQSERLAIPTCSADAAASEQASAQAIAQAAAQVRAAAVIEAQKAVEETKAQAAEELRTERARAAKVAKAAQAEAADALEKRAAESRAWREKAAAEAEKRSRAASKAASATAKAEEQTAAAMRERARADAAEERAAVEKARADAAEAAARIATEQVARASEPRQIVDEATPAAEAEITTMRAADTRSRHEPRRWSAASRDAPGAAEAANMEACDDADPFPVTSVASASAARRIHRSQERATRLPSPTAPSLSAHGGGGLQLNRPDLIERLYPDMPPRPTYAPHYPGLPPRPTNMHATPNEAAHHTGSSASSATFTPRTAAVVETSRKEAQLIQQLGFIFPALPEVELRAALERFEWSLDAAACELIDVVGLD